MTSTPLDLNRNVLAEIQDKRERVRIQMDYHQQHRFIQCGCGKVVGFLKTYRCLYCGEWFCEQCAEVHFGMTRAEWNLRKSAPSAVKK